MTHVVRTTDQPDKEIEVDDAEYLDLQRQGLLIEDPKGSKKKDSGSGSGSGSGGTSNTNSGS